METDSTEAILEDAFSYLSPIGYRKSSKCGYCRRTRTGRSYYARATSMSPAFYQSLVDRCWRRSGTLLYRPNQQDACCPHYTLRLDSYEFRATKDQRQAVNRFNKYILGNEYSKEAARLYPKSREESKKRDNEFDLPERIHECETEAVKAPPQPGHQFTVTLEPDDFTEEKYAVFENYQRIVHKETPDEISRDGFKRFLCKSPLKQGTYRSGDGKERPLGSFHQCYRLDGQLVAIGVLDLLPKSVSAVYFLYHASVHKFSPGKLGALREIALAAELGYQYWYSGFYIHTCPKMRYKIDYSPQYVLDPDKYIWKALDKHMLARFDDHGYLHFSNDRIRDDRATTATGDITSMDVDGQPADGSGSDSGSADDEEEEEEEDDRSLFGSHMPGIPSPVEMQSFDLEHVPVRLKGGYLYAGDLFEWGDQSITEPRSPKGMIAELIAAVGTQLSDQWCLDFRGL